MPRSLLVASSAAFLLAVAPAAESAVVFNFSYADAAGTGFNDPTLGAARRGALQDIANNYLGTLLDYDATVDLTVNGGNLGTPGYLATAGSSYYPSQGRNQQGFVQQHVVTGVDPLADYRDGTVNVNFSYGFYYGADPAGIGAGEFDFRTVLLHELTHTLGFLSLFSDQGNGLNDGRVSGTYTAFDEYLVTANGTKLFDLSDADYAAAIRSDAVYFAGPNATAANGGSRPRIYAPGTFTASSLGHWNSFGPVMYYAIPPQAINRQFSGIDLGALQDLGYNLAGVPEPATLVLGGAGVLILLGRRRGRTAA